MASEDTISPIPDGRPAAKVSVAGLQKELDTVRSQQADLDKTVEILAGMIATLESADSAPLSAVNLDCRDLAGSRGCTGRLGGDRHGTAPAASRVRLRPAPTAAAVGSLRWRIGGYRHGTSAAAVGRLRWHRRIRHGTAPAASWVRVRPAATTGRVRWRIGGNRNGTAAATTWVRRRATTAATTTWVRLRATTATAAGLRCRIGRDRHGTHRRLRFGPAPPPPPPVEREPARLAPR